VKRTSASLMLEEGNTVKSEMWRCGCPLVDPEWRSIRFGEETLCLTKCEQRWRVRGVFVDWEDFIEFLGCVESLVGSSELAAGDEVDDSMTTGNAVVRGLKERFAFLDVRVMRFSVEGERRK